MIVDAWGDVWTNGRVRVDVRRGETKERIKNCPNFVALVLYEEAAAGRRRSRSSSKRKTPTNDGLTNAECDAETGITNDRPQQLYVGSCHGARSTVWSTAAGVEKTND